MKKLYLVLIVLLFCAAANAEQTATLVHNGSSKVFYGTNAFKTACDSAVSGDVITLSSGRFSAYNSIRKNITVRGCGWKGAGKTEIYERISIQIPTADTVSHLCLEGIKFYEINIDTLLHNPSFSKCWIGNLSLYNVFNGTISNCHIDVVRRYNGDKRYQLTFVNCIVNSDDVPNLSFINCIVGGKPTNYGNVYINCIMTNDYYDLYQESTAINCVYFGGSNNFFSQCFGSNNSVVTSKYILFKNDFRMDDNRWFRFDDGTTDDAFELRPEIQAQYLGNDGTQIGIYGGLRPFTTELSYPIIIDLQVAPTSSADGKLDVNIEVTNAE